MGYYCYKFRLCFWTQVLPFVALLMIPLQANADLWCPSASCWRWQADKHASGVWLCVCLTPIITKVWAPSTKKAPDSAVPGASSFTQPFRHVLGIWFIVSSSWFAAVLSHFVAGKHSVVEFLAGLPGIKCWESNWLDVLSSPKRRWWWKVVGWG